MRIVWVVNNKAHDLTAAGDFGEVRKLIEGSTNVFAIDRIIADLKQKLHESLPEDYLLLCGAIPLNVIAAGVMMELHGKINLLIFDLKSQVYAARTYTMEDLQ